MAETKCIKKSNRPRTTLLPVLGNNLINFLDDLYEQCSDHSAPTMSFSSWLGVRLNFLVKNLNSLSVSALMTGYQY